MKHPYLIKFIVFLFFALHIGQAMAECPIANAGPDQIVCSTQGAVQLEGKITGGAATGLKWSSDGKGTFSSTLGLTPIYYPTGEDLYRGEVKILLTVKSSSCADVVDEMIIDLNMLPVVNAGPDRVMCAGSKAFFIPQGIYANYKKWSSTGAGTFTSSNDTTFFQPSALEVSAGNAIVLLTGYNTPGCPDFVDTVKVKINAPGIVNAGPDVMLCSTAKSVVLKGKTTSSKVKWTSSGWGQFTNAASPETEYQLLETDKSNTLTLTLSTDVEGCPPVSDQVKISWEKGPQMHFDYVPPGEVCSNNTLSFEAVATKPYKFTTTATGRIDSTKYDLAPGVVKYNLYYTPSKEDSEAGQVVFRIQGSATQICPARDTAVIKFINFSVNAGPDITICNSSYNQGISLVGKTSEPVEIMHWYITNAFGSLPFVSSLSNIYLPAKMDTVVGKIELRFEAAGKCGTAVDTKFITFVPTTSIMATTHSRHWDTLVCPGQPLVLEGKTNSTDGIQWLTAGTGYFSPNATSLKTTYIPSELDIVRGGFGLQIRAADNAICQAQDTLVAKFIVTPTIDAGPDQFVDPAQASVQLNGISSDASDRLFWSSNGTGNFSVTEGANPLYYPTVADVVKGSVTVQVSSFLNNACGSSSDEMRIIFMNTPLANISGSVLLEDKSKAAGTTVSLFLQENSVYKEIESFTTKTGDFVFANKPAGKYLVYATPQSPYNTSNIPTYSGNVKEWADATPIVLSGKTITAANIRLLPYVKSTDLNGVDNIAGTVTFGDLNLRVSSLSAEPVEGATVYLLDAKFNELTYTTTNVSGIFLFSNLAKGIYKLKYEYPGVKSFNLDSKVDGDPTTLSSGTVTLERSLVVTSMPDAVSNTEMILVAPNPASESVQINTGSVDAFDFTVINAAGIVEMEGKAISGNEKISVENLNPGIYVIKIVQNNNVFKAKILKK